MTLAPKNDAVRSASAEVDPAQDAAVVRASGVFKTYGEGERATPVLFDVSLSVRAGELALLMGPSGSGKTTLISILAGLLRPTSGHVELCGHAVSAMSESDVARVRRRHVGFVFQTYNLFPALTALDNVAEVLALKGTSIRLARAKARDALERVGLGARTHHRPADLSGGEKQRVAIARAMAGDPAVIIGDEPTAALDGATAMQVMGLLESHVTDQAAVLLVTHDHRLEKFADRIIRIEDGRVVEESVMPPRRST